MILLWNSDTTATSGKNYHNFTFEYYLVEI